MSTRPRIEFDEDGRCNACIWSERKKSLNWKEREQQLIKLLDAAKKRGNAFDCLVPVSGGKDGSYVAHTLRERYGVKALAVTVTPALSREIGDQNLRGFIESGFDHISINPHPEIMRKLNRVGFEEIGFPYYGWLMAIHTAVIRVAVQFDVSLIFYGEDGEVEYGGTNITEEAPVFDARYMRDVYLSGGYRQVLDAAQLPKRDTYFFEFPDDKTLDNFDLQATHWSYFENWDPYRNYLIAKEHCGLQEADANNSGTFTNFSQNDQKLYALHTYIMYLKFGFGRANQDSAIEIRRGAMDRDQAINLINLYDGQYPTEFIDDYLTYYRMTLEEFEAVLDKWVNKELFTKEKGRWLPKFTVR